MGDQRADFAITKYGYDREHELKLNEFTHALEMEQLKLLILLNGGAATVFLTFGKDTGLTSHLLAIGLPVALWLAGLCLGAWATIEMRSTQSHYTRAYRFRRRAEEWRQMRVQLEDEEIEERLGLADEAPPEGADGPQHYDAAAWAVTKIARRASKRIAWISLASLACFLSGAIAAALLIAATPGPAAEQPHPGNTTAAKH